MPVLRRQAVGLEVQDSQRNAACQAAVVLPLLPRMAAFREATRSTQMLTSQPYHRLHPCSKLGRIPYMLLAICLVPATTCKHGACLGESVVWHTWQVGAWNTRRAAYCLQRATAWNAPHSVSMELRARKTYNFQFFHGHLQFIPHLTRHSPRSSLTMHSP